MPENLLPFARPAFALCLGVIATCGGAAGASPSHTFSPAINAQEDVSISPRRAEEAHAYDGERTIIFAGGNGQYFITIPSQKHTAAGSKSNKQAQR